MNEWSNKVFVADQDSPWRANLLKQLEAHHLPAEAIAVTEYGLDIQRALLDEEAPPTVLVASHQLKGMGGLEAIYQAYRKRGSRDDRLRPTLCLIAEVRSDVELLDLFRRRGVRLFLHREDPLEETAASILNAHFGDMRRAPRHPVKIPVEIEVEGKKATGLIENISDGGCLVAVRDRKITDGCTVGNQIGLQFTVEDLSVQCAAEVRQLAARRRLLGDLLLIGVRFVNTDFDALKKIETIVRRLNVARKTVPNPFSLSP